MEYVDGRDLSTLLRASREAKQPVPVDVALRVAASVCAALDCAHNAKDDQGRFLQIVHRDVSPHNVLVGNDGSIKLTDFGIAHAADKLEQTLPGVIKGKVSYLAPETLSGAEPDPRTDIFAAGILLYECLAGYQPFKRSTEYQTYQAIQDHILPPITASRTDVDAEVDGILARATAKDPARRYPGAAGMLHDLERVIADLRRPAGAPVIAAWVASLAGFSGEFEKVREKTGDPTDEKTDERTGESTGGRPRPTATEEATKTLKDKPK
jgi:eukaryotic-like serine/threonine-protein kinase